MKQVRYNNQSSSDVRCGITFYNNSATFNIADNTDMFYGMCVINDIKPYHSYLVIRTTGMRKTRDNGSIYASDFHVVDMNKLSVAFDVGFARIITMHGWFDYLSIDTGHWDDTQHDMIITSFRGKYGSVTINDNEFEQVSFSSKEHNASRTPRYDLWDGYDFQFNSDKPLFTDSFDHRLQAHAVTVDDEYVNITIHKRKATDGTPLTNDNDNEQIVVLASAGLVNTRALFLKNGTAKIRWYPFGHKGRVIFYIGRPSFPKWSKYVLEVK